MTTFLLLALLLITILSIVNVGYVQWRHHQQRAVATHARGWRYRHRGWYAFWDNHYSIAGSTATGIIWQLTKEKFGKQFYFRWTTEYAPLEHGSLQIFPQTKLNVHPLSAGSKKHLNARMGNERWQKEYAVLTTHKFSTEKYISQEVQQAMLAWPKWPEPGALEQINWQKDKLQIDGRYHDDWDTVERMVSLGILLTAQHINAPLVKK